MYIYIYVYCTPLWVYCTKIGQFWQNLIFTVQITFSRWEKNRKKTVARRFGYIAGAAAGVHIPI